MSAGEPTAAPPVDPRATDATFLAGFEDCSLVPFHHGDHIRAAWLYLEQYGYEEGTERMIASIKRFAHHHNVNTLYHETITRAWMWLVHRARLETPATEWEAFAAQHPDLLNKGAIQAFYSPELLATPAAKESWVPADRRPLP